MGNQVILTALRGMRLFSDSPIFKKIARFDIEGFLTNLKFPGVVGLLFVVGFIAYGRVISYPFVHDDIVFIQQRNPGDIHWDFSYLLHATPAKGMLPYYRPFVEVLNTFELMVFGINPWPYHLTNIILHILNGIFVYVLTGFLLKNKNLSFWAAMLFLTHPVQTEAVAAIAGVTNLLFTFFCLLSFILYVLTSEKSCGRWGLVVYGLSLLLFLLALFAKEPAVILPILLIIYEILFGNTASHGSLQKKILRLLGFFIVDGAYLLFRKMVLGTVLFSFLDDKYELWLRVLAIPKVLLTNISIILFPVNLHYYRSVDILEPFFWPLLCFIAVIVAVIFFLYSLPIGNRRVIIFGLAWFLVALLPTLNILPLIIEYSHIFASEHFLYFPLAGMIVAVLWLVEHYTRTKNVRSKRKVSLILILISVIFVSLTIKQNAYWRGEIPLFRRVLSFEKQLGRVHILLGRAYYFNRETDKATPEYLTAFNILQGYVDKANVVSAKNFYLGFIKEIHFDLAHCYEAKGELLRSIEEYTKAIVIDPLDSVLQNNIAANYLTLNHVNAAIEHLNESLRLNPKNVMAINTLAVCYINKGDFKEAERLFRYALEIDSHFSLARDNLKKLLANK